MVAVSYSMIHNISVQHTGNVTLTLLLLDFSSFDNTTYAYYIIHTNTDA